MTLHIKRMRDDAVLPYRGSDEAAGLDLTLCESGLCDAEGPKLDFFTPSRLRVGAGSCARIPIGWAVQIPQMWMGVVFPRSSATFYLDCSHPPIDSDYRGEISVIIRALEHDLDLKPGDRVAQLAIIPALTCPVLEVAELSPTKRGAGGFGSTGR